TAAGHPLVLTANAGPAQLRDFPPRLPSVLSAGLVVGIDQPSQASRRYLLDRLAQRVRLPAAPEVLDWLSGQAVGGVRPLLGAITTLQALSAGSARALDLGTVQSRWP